MLSAFNGGVLTNYFDLHCDTPYECYFKKQPFCENTLAVSGKKGLYFKDWHQVFAVWIKDDAENPFKLYKNILNDFKLKLFKMPDNLTPHFAVEGGAVIEDDISRLDALYSDGIRFLTLTWNGENRIAGGSKTEKGLTAFGRGVIKEMNRLKIACDLSHLNDKSFFGAIEYAEYPLATHSNCREVFSHPRNLTDEQIKLLAQKNGIIGLCPYPAFLGGDVYEKMYENIYRLLNMGLENNISIGSDFDGADMDEKLSDISKMPSLYRFLSGRGISERLLEKIFYKNACNFVKTFDKHPAV